MLRRPSARPGWGGRREEATRAPRLGTAGGGGCPGTSTRPEVASVPPAGLIVFCMSLHSASDHDQGPRMPGPPSPTPPNAPCPSPARVQREAEAPTCARSALKRRWPTQKLSPPATGQLAAGPPSAAAPWGHGDGEASRSGSAQRPAGRRAPVPASGASYTCSISRTLEARASQRQRARRTGPKGRPLQNSQGGPGGQHEERWSHQYPVCQK